MLDDCIYDQEWKLSALDQPGQQQRIFAADCAGIEHTRLDINLRSPNRKTGRVQISQATVRLQQVILERYEAQFFHAANQRCAIAREAELKAIVLGELAIVEAKACRQFTSNLESASANTRIGPLEICAPQLRAADTPACGCLTMVNGYWLFQSLMKSGAGSALPSSTRMTSKLGGFVCCVNDRRHEVSAAQSL